jgi:hypothetical protein
MEALPVLVVSALPLVAAVVLLWNGPPRHNRPGPPGYR